MAKAVRSTIVTVAYRLIIYYQVVYFIGDNSRLAESACFLPNTLNQYGMRINSECL